jgi:adenylate cyclase
MNDATEPNTVNSDDRLPLCADPIAAWLVHHGGDALESRELLDQLCLKLTERGMRLLRVVVGLPTLHPQIITRSLTWHRGRGIEQASRDHDVFQSASYLDSPVALIHQGAAAIRRRLGRPETELDFPILHELRAAGATDYLVLPLRFTRGRPSFVSWATDAPEGFSATQLRLLDDILPLLALRFEIEVRRTMLNDLLATYLGGEAARKVVAGAVRRGGGELVRAAIWYCDLRGFTRLADRTPPADMIALLDAYYDRVAAPVQERGGEVLKFIGDAMLAIFRCDKAGDGAACELALDAAVDALGRLRLLNQARARDRAPRLDIGIALHLGDVMYGNIGASDRLDFTVIGAAVNLAARLEAKCVDLGEPLLATSAFAASCAAGSLRSLGSHRLRDVRQPTQIFTVAGEAARAAVPKLKSDRRSARR